MQVLDHYAGTTPSSGDVKYIRGTPNGTRVLQLERGATVRMGNLNETDGCWRCYQPAAGWIRTYDLQNVHAVYKEIAAPTVPTVPSTSIEMGSLFTVSAKPDLSSFTHNIALKIGETVVDTVVTDNVRDPATGLETWTIATDFTQAGVDWLSFTPNSASVEGALSLATYQSNGTLEGTRTITLTFTVPQSVVPTPGEITISRAVDDPTNGKVAEYVQIRTRLQIDMAASAPGSFATLASVVLRAEGKQLAQWNANASGGTHVHSGYIPAGHGDLPVSVTATDSRGRSATKTVLVPVSRYYAPIIGSVTAIRCDELGMEDANESSLAITVPVDSKLQDGQLQLTISLALALVRDPGNYTPIGTALEGTRTLFVDCADPDEYFTLRIQAADGLSTATQIIEIEGGKPIMDFWGGGKGIGIGLTATRPNVVEIGGRYKPAGDGIFETWTHTATVGNTHDFIGFGNCGKVKLMHPIYPGDTFAINGMPVAAFLEGEPVRSLSDGSWILFLIDYENAEIHLLLGAKANALPSFTYTGDYLITKTPGDWQIEFLSSGTLTIARDALIDLFLVGGGGAGGKSTEVNWCGGGGGGGYTSSYQRIAIIKNTPYELVVGAGGATSAGSGYTGGTSGAFGREALGGRGGAGSGGGGVGWGGSGGSGGGAGGWARAGKAGGIDGADGGDNGDRTGGIGQRSTTRAFHEPEGQLYASGGKGSGNGTIGAKNTGNGGNGSLSTSGSGAGGSGIIIIRKAR